MDFSELFSDIDESTSETGTSKNSQSQQPQQTQQSQQTQQPQNAQIPEELLKKISALEEAVKLTQTKADDVLLQQQKARLISEYNNFKASRPDITDEMIFGALEAKFQEFVKSGMTKEQAQETVDRLYMNPIGWGALSDELRYFPPKKPDEMLPANGTGEKVGQALNKASLGEFLNKGATK